MNNAQKPLVIYVEDDEEDQELCQFALEESQLDVDIRFINDGRTAMQLFDELLDDETRQSWPHLLILDLSMPAINGWDLLKRFRSLEDLRCVPVVVFTTSSSPRDMGAAYAAGANAYMIKPAGLKELTDNFNTTLKYWTQIVARHA